LISANDLERFFNEAYKHDGDYVLQQLVQERRFADMAKQALAIWETRSVPNLNNEYDHHAALCFRMKLLLTHHEGTEDDLDAIAEPKLKSSGDYLKFSGYEEKRFYKALILLRENKSEKAYEIFQSQFLASPEDRSTLALNMFAARLHWADNTRDLQLKRKLYLDAIEEWLTFEKKSKNSVDLEYIKDKIWYNKLHAFGELGDEVQFDQIYSDLERPFQLRTDLLELRVKNLVGRKLHAQAETLLYQAEDYHRLSDGEVPDNILKLRALTDTIESTKFLQDQYLRILAKPPEDIIKLLPEYESRYANLDEFVLRLLTLATGDMLNHINSVSDIGHEDKYTDLVRLSLSGKISTFGWHCGPDRSGHPGSLNANLGLLDFTISGKHERIAICEALILEGRNTSELQSHQFKIFNYDAVRSRFYILVYYKGPEKRFVTNWTNYKADIPNKIVFPSGFELQGDTVKDLSEKFGTDTVKVGRTIHGERTPIFHIYININYEKDLMETASI